MEREELEREELEQGRDNPGAVIVWLAIAGGFWLGLGLLSWAVLYAIAH